VKLSRRSSEATNRSCKTEEEVALILLIYIRVSRCEGRAAAVPLTPERTAEFIDPVIIAGFSLLLGYTLVVVLLFHALRCPS
jgi:hypothetical protein